MNIFKNLNVKKNPITTVLGILNTLLFGAVILGLFDQATADHILLIVSNFADVLGTSPTLVVVGTALQAAGSIILLFAKDPQEPSGGSGGNVIRAIAILALPGLLLMSCSKIDQAEAEIITIEMVLKSENPNQYTNAQLQLAAENTLQEMISRKESQADIQTGIPVKNYGAKLNFVLDDWLSAGTFGFCYPRLVVDSGAAYMASLSCIIDAGPGVSFSPGTVMIDYANPRQFNWQNYFYASRVTSDYVAFAGFSVQPETLTGTTPVNKTLFAFHTTGYGPVTWDETYPDNITASPDGWGVYAFNTKNGSMQ